MSAGSLIRTESCEFFWHRRVNCLPSILLTSRLWRKYRMRTLVWSTLFSASLPRVASRAASPLQKAAGLPSPG